MTAPSKIIIVDRQVLFAEALAATLQAAWPDADVVVASALTPELADGASVALIEMAGVAPPNPCEGAAFIAMATDGGKEDAVCALQAGARGFVSKTMAGDAIREAVSLVLRGSAVFPADALAEISRAGAASAAVRCRRELEVLLGLGRGLSNKLIARELGVSVATVKSHVQAILRATDAKNRTEAVVNARRLGMLPSH